MSAQVSFLPEEPTNPAPNLSLVPPLRSTVSTVGFVLIVMALVALGLSLVMVVTTSVASQSKELSELRKEAVLLEYRAASLTTRVQEISSTASLAMRASDLGMVPNVYPAFIRISDGVILGEPTAVTGKEAPYLRRQVPTPLIPSRVGGAGSDEAGAVQLLPVAPGTNQ